MFMYAIMLVLFWYIFLFRLRTTSTMSTTTSSSRAKCFRSWLMQTQIVWWSRPWLMPGIRKKTGSSARQRRPGTELRRRWRNWRGSRTPRAQTTTSVSMVPTVWCRWAGFHPCRNCCAPLHLVSLSLSLSLSCPPPHPHPLSLPLSSSLTLFFLTLSPSLPTPQSLSLFSTTVFPCDLTGGCTFSSRSSWRKVSNGFFYIPSWRPGHTRSGMILQSI